MHKKRKDQQYVKTYGLGANILKWYDWQKVSIQNIKAAHITQYQKKNTIKNGQKTSINIFPKKENGKLKDTKNWKSDTDERKWRRHKHLERYIMLMDWKN